MTTRMTVSLPDELAKRLKKRARQSRRPVSRLVEDALLEEERRRRDEKMAAAYREMAAENKALADALFPDVGEGYAGG